MRFSSSSHDGLWLARRRKKKEEEPQNPEIFTSPHLLPSFNRQATNTPSSLPWYSEWKVWDSTDEKYFYFFLRKWEPSVNQVGINIRIYISSGFVANPTPPFPTNQPEYSSSSLSLNSGKILAGGRGKERGGGGKDWKKPFYVPITPFPPSAFRACIYGGKRVSLVLIASLPAILRRYGRKLFSPATASRSPQLQGWGETYTRKILLCFLLWLDLIKNSKGGEIQGLCDETYRS